MRLHGDPTEGQGKAYAHQLLGAAALMLVESGRRPVSKDERDGPQTATCTYEFLRHSQPVSVPDRMPGEEESERGHRKTSPSSRNRLSKFGVRTSRPPTDAWDSELARPKMGRRSSTCVCSTGTGTAHVSSALRRDKLDRHHAARSSAGSHSQHEDVGLPWGRC